MTKRIYKNQRIRLIRSMICRAFMLLILIIGLLRIGIIIPLQVLGAGQDQWQPVSLPVKLGWFLAPTKAFPGPIILRDNFISVLENNGKIATSTDAGATWRLDDRFAGPPGKLPLGIAASTDKLFVIAQNPEAFQRDVAGSAWNSLGGLAAACPISLEFNIGGVRANDHWLSVLCQKAVRGGADHRRVGWLGSICSIEIGGTDWKCATFPNSVSDSYSAGGVIFSLIGSHAFVSAPTGVRSTRLMAVDLNSLAVKDVWPKQYETFKRSRQYVFTVTFGRDGRVNHISDVYYTDLQNHRA